jgi:hypothetical protein
VSSRTGLTPPDEVESSPPGGSIVVLVGRATHVPQAAVTSGIWRSITVNRIGPLSWLTAPDLGDPAAEKLHGMQGGQAVAESGQLSDQ